MIESNYICDRCKEPLGLISLAGNVLIRPWRFSRCKNYNGAGSETCLGIGKNTELAVISFEHLTEAKRSA